MRRVTGILVQSTTLGEVVRAFMPLPLPPNRPVLNAADFLSLNQKAELSLARLSAMSGLVPSVDWLLYSAIRKEALLTSQIEGTQATLTDLFDDEAGLEVSNTDDVEEVTNYIAAYRWVRDNLRSPKGLPISVRLLCQAHKRLLNGVRGTGKQPGALRRSQNWIGGSRPGNAQFVPPPPQEVPALMSDLEKFMGSLPGKDGSAPSTSSQLPPLVGIAMAHAQFETIHPFLDGNGRIGRLLIAALLEDKGLLPEPLMYLSGYLKQHQAEYYRLLTGIRSAGDWESWIRFFLEGIEEAATQSEQSIVKVASLVAADRRQLLATLKGGAVAYRLFELLPMMPRFTVERVRTALDTSFPTANAAVKTLMELGLISETTGNKKNRSFSYHRYITILSG